MGSAPRKTSPRKRAGKPASPAARSRRLGGKIKNLIGRPSDDSDPVADAGAARILAGVQQVSTAASASEWAESVGKTLPAITGLPIVAVLLRNQRTEALSIACMHDPDGLLVATDGYVNICEESGREAAASKAVTDIQFEASKDRKIKSGIAMPVISRGYVLGAACLFIAGSATPQHEQTVQAEKFLGIAAPFLIAARSQPLPSSANALDERLNTELRIAGRSPDNGPQPQQARITFDGLMLDPLTERSHVGDVAVSLSKTEFKVLYALATEPGSALSQSAIKHASGAASGVDVTMHRLRRKLARAPQGDSLIQTVRGKGYMLVPPGN